MSVEIAKKISRHKVFSELDQEELLSIAAICDRISYQDGDILYDTLHMPNFMFYIEDGTFLLQMPNSDIIHYNPGELVGEVAVISGDFRSGTVIATSDASVIRICGTRLFLERFVAPKTALKVVRALSRRITNYLRSTIHVSTKELMQQGENDHVEFKSTLRYNKHIQKKDKKIEHAVLKTIAAMLNTEGGMLLVGVNDDGEAIGLEEDHFANRDKMLLHLTGLIKHNIGSLHLKYVHSSIEEVDGKDVLRVDCNPSSRPAFCLDGEEEHFYIRTGPATTSLSISKAHQYIIDHFGVQKNKD